MRAMHTIPFFSGEDIAGALQGTTIAFEVALPETQDAQVMRDRHVWVSAMDAIAATLGIEWRDGLVDITPEEEG